ncbi:11045_t:CDS:2, partial [Gigaspora margarita]
MDIIDPSISVNWQEQPVTIDQCAINLVYDHICKVNISSISLASPYELFRRFLPLNYIEQFIINSINICGRDTSNWAIVNINEYVIWLGLWVLMSAFPVADCRFYWRTNPEITQPMVLFNFQHWMNAPNFNDPLYSVRSFINAFNSNLIEAIRPRNTLCIDESTNSWLGEKNKIPDHLANGFTNIIIQLEPCEEKEIEKKADMIQKLGNAYGSYCLKVAVVNGTHLIAAFLKDRKPQCIIAIASTTTQGDEVERVVKECNNLSLVKFAQPKIFSEYSSSKAKVVKEVNIDQTKYANESEYSNELEYTYKSEDPNLLTSFEKVTSSELFTLLPNESIESHVWMFEEILKATGKQLRIIMTDANPAADLAVHQRICNNNQEIEICDASEQRKIYEKLYSTYKKAINKALTSQSNSQQLIDLLKEFTENNDESSENSSEDKVDSDKENEDFVLKNPIKGMEGIDQQVLNISNQHMNKEVKKNSKDIVRNMAWSVITKKTVKNNHD